MMILDGTGPKLTMLRVTARNLSNLLRVLEFQIECFLKLKYLQEM